MPSFNPQKIGGINFKLSPSSLIRQFIAYFYHYSFLYLNNKYITFDLWVNYPSKHLEVIEYEWQVYDKKTKQEIEFDSMINRSGKIEFVQGKFMSEAISNGKPLKKYINIPFHWPLTYYGIHKAINLGYVVNDMRCFIKIKFKIGEDEFTSAPMASFNVYDSDDWHKVVIELIIAAGIGVIIGFIMRGFV